MPGTEEIRTKIGHLGFWCLVNYGNAIFMTVSPGERHNYLAIRLSRYRHDDPYMTADTETARKEQRWIGPDTPSLEPSSEDVYEVAKGCPWKVYLQSK